MTDFNTMLCRPSSSGLRISAFLFLAAAGLVCWQSTRPQPMDALRLDDPVLIMGASRPGTITATTVSEGKLAHVAGKSITVEIVEFAPLAFAPEHHHAGSVTVYVLSGTIRSQLGGGPVEEFKAGQSFFEPSGTVHLFAENPSPTEPAKFMAIHIAEDGAELTTYH
jgi:quercetin dioxygenase-like cupin family protein